MARRLSPRLSRQRSAAGIERRGGEGRRRQNLSGRSRKLKEKVRGGEMTAAKAQSQVDAGRRGSGLRCHDRHRARARGGSNIEEVAIGRPTLTKTDAISMDSGDLYNSPDIVRVKCRFTDTASARIWVRFGCLD